LFLVFANKILTDNKYTAACALRNNVSDLNDSCQPFLHAITKLHKICTVCVKLRTQQ